MTDAAIDQTHALLLHVADFLKKLPADQIGDLLRGEARLALIPKGARVAGAAGARATRATATAVDPDRVAVDLARIDDRAAATRYVDDLRLTVAGLKDLCKALDVPVSSKVTKAGAVTAIVDLLVGRRIDGDALRRNAAR
ncbi:MAG: hypothetical protein HOV79_25410 [Hamadaea sp.]|nr:hypothetical protein [Hamadaea sp.]